MAAVGLPCTFFAPEHQQGRSSGTASPPSRRRLFTFIQNRCEPTALYILLGNFPALFRLAGHGYVSLVRGGKELFVVAFVGDSTRGQPRNIRSNFMWRFSLVILHFWIGRSVQGTPDQNNFCNVFYSLRGWKCQSNHFWGNCLEHVHWCLLSSEWLKYFGIKKIWSWISVITSTFYEIF